jgi:hypothetical protein
MSDGISDGFPFADEIYKLTEAERDKLILSLVKHHLVKDARINVLEGLLRELHYWYTMNPDLRRRIDKVLK